MTNKTNIDEYFESLAVKYLGHSEDEPHFFRYGLDEFLKGFHKNASPALLLEGYEFGYIDKKSDNILKSREITLMVVSNTYGDNSPKAKTAAYDKAEEIIDNMTLQMLADKAALVRPFLVGFNAENVRAVQLDNEVRGDYGYFVTINIESRL